MSLVTRTYTFTDGTTAYGSQVDSEIANLVNTFNNLDTATLKWDQVSVLNSAGVPLVVDNSTGSQDIVNFKANSVTKVSIDSTGLLKPANGVTVSGASLTMSGQTIAMGANKITGVANGSTSTDVAAYGQVSPLWAYRRPVLQFSSTTVINMETGINGTSGQAQILFPDGTLRTDSTTGRINCNLAQVAALSGTAQSGLRTGSIAANTWYAVYAVKTSDNTSNFVAVADTVLPIQANYATLNSNFGSNSWVYLGLIRTGNNDNVTTAALDFIQAGAMTVFRTQSTSSNLIGIAYLGSSNTVLTYTYASGTSNAQIPNNISIVSWAGFFNSGTGPYQVMDSAGSFRFGVVTANGGSTRISSGPVPASFGLQVSQGASSSLYGCLVSFVDGALGVGANPLL